MQFKFVFVILFTLQVIAQQQIERTPNSILVSNQDVIANVRSPQRSPQRSNSRSSTLARWAAYLQALLKPFQRRGGRKPAARSKTTPKKTTTPKTRGARSALNRPRPKPSRTSSKKNLVKDAIHHHLSLWNYSAPEEWSDMFTLCKGQSQSPVNIVSSELKRLQKTDTHLHWKGYDSVPQSLVIANNGHTAIMKGTWASGKEPCVKGGPLGDSWYCFAQCHFHWGPNNRSGSEHKIGGKSFPLEYHVVHYRKSYGNILNALNHEDGVAVVGIFFSESTTVNYGMSKLTNSFDKIRRTGSKIALKPFSLNYLISPFKDEYASYKGSLTTPPCNEVVQWILHSRPRSLSQRQMAMFRQLMLDDGANANVRPVQKLNSRTVYFAPNDKIMSFNPSGNGGGVGETTTSGGGNEGGGEGGGESTPAPAE